VQLELAAEHTLTVHAGTRRVRVRQAAWSLHRLRVSLGEHDQATAANRSRAARRAERRAQIALTRAGLPDAVVADEVLRLARILSQTAALATLDYTALPARPGSEVALNGHAASRPRQPDDPSILGTACEVVARARQQGVRLSQAALARELRAQGLSIANERLHRLAAASGLNHPGDQ